MSVETRLAELGYTLPPAPVAVANYVPFVVTGNLVFVSGQISRLPGEEVFGTLGEDVDIEKGQHAARLSALAIMAQTKAALGSLDRVTRIVRLNAFVNCTPDFVDQPKVVNGASDLFAAAFGEKGSHSRSALGVASLPLGAAVEIDAVIEFA